MDFENMMEEMLDEEFEEGSEEEPENAEEQAAEETAEGEDTAAEEEKGPKLYTDEELERLIEERANARVDELLPSKLERRSAKRNRELEGTYAPYKDTERILKAGLGVNSIEEANTKLREFYTGQGVSIPEATRPSYSKEDLRILADSEARQIIELGSEEVKEEVDRLAAKGHAHMTEREKLVFHKLAEYRSEQERRQQLLGMGIKAEEVDSDEFKTFASQFNPKTPMQAVYDLYTKTQNKPPIEKMASVKNRGGEGEKRFYTSEEVDKLTDKDLDDPKVLERVMESMRMWK